MRINASLYNKPETTSESLPARKIFSLCLLHPPLENILVLPTEFLHHLKTSPNSVHCQIACSFYTKTARFTHVKKHSQRLCLGKKILFSI